MTTHIAHLVNRSSAFLYRLKTNVYFLFYFYEKMWLLNCNIAIPTFKALFNSLFNAFLGHQSVICLWKLMPQMHKKFFVSVSHWLFLIIVNILLKY